MSEALVSVIIPVFNCEDYLGESIESVLNQTYQNIEVIVVDDGSTDNSVQIAKNFSRSGVKVFRQENTGACAARNLGVTKSAGEYIQFLDADDWLATDKIEKQVRTLESVSGTTNVAFGRWCEYYSKKDIRYPDLKIYRDYKRPVDLLTDMWCEGEMLSPATWLTHRNLIENAGPWDESLKVNQDGEFFSRVVLNATKLTFTPTMSYYRKGNPGSVSNSRLRPEKAASLLRSYILYEEHVENYKEENRVRRGLADNYYGFIYTYYHLFPDLVNQAMATVKALGMEPDREKTGAENFRKISRFLGFYSTLKLRKILYKTGLLNMMRG